MNCNKCKWSDAWSGNYRVCGYLLQGGETVYIRNGKIKETCPLKLEEKMKEVIDKLIKSQKELPAEIVKIVDKNFWELI